MTTLKLDTLIRAAPAAVYDYVTRPARWHEWHPASLGAEAHAMESLGAGARFEEDIRSSGFKRHLRWQVAESQPGQRWTASAVMDDGSRVQLLYELSDESGATRFTRTLDYQVKPPVLRWLNDLIFWRRVRAESLRALENLRQHFEPALKTPTI